MDERQKNLSQYRLQEAADSLIIKSIREYLFSVN